MGLTDDPADYQPQNANDQGRRHGRDVSEVRAKLSQRDFASGAGKAPAQPDSASKGVGHLADTRFMTSAQNSRGPNIALQVYAIAFLAIGAGLGAWLGYKVGAVSDGELSYTTMQPVYTDTKPAFNWLYFEIGAASGLVACAVLLAASFLAPRSGPET